MRGRAVDSASLRIEGYASLWGVADLNGDVVAKGTFADSLAKTGAARRADAAPARGAGGGRGLGRMVEDERGLFVRGRIMDWSAEARFAGAGRAGALDGLSIGFRSSRARRDGRLRVLTSRWSCGRCRW
jgi:HK97 family phage prohead protease